MGKLTIKRPATLKDYVRSYGIKGDTLRKAKKLVQKVLRSAA